MPVRTRGLFLTPEDLADMESKMNAWEQDPGAMNEWAKRSAKLTLLVLEKIILKASGRRAPQDISVAADRLQRLLSTMAQMGMLTPGPAGLLAAEPTDEPFIEHEATPGAHTTQVENEE